MPSRHRSILAVATIVAVSALLASCGNDPASRSGAGATGTSTPDDVPPATTVLHAPDGAADDYFGGAYWYDTYQSPVKGVYYATPGEAALDGAGHVALVGAPGHSHAGLTGAGAAFVFVEGDAGWASSAELRADDAGKYDGFGWTVALARNGNRAVVGAPENARGDGSRVGAAYVFDRTGSTWSQTALLRPDDSKGYDSFGWSVAISPNGEWVLVGAIGSRTDAKAKGGGAAHLFHRTAQGWSRVATFRAAQPVADEDFGAAVALSADGTTAAVTTRDHVDGAGTHHRGRLHVYTTADGWATSTEKAVITHPNRNDDDTGDAYGVNVTLSDDGRIAAVAAPDVNVDIARLGDAGRGAGAVYVYTTKSAWAPGDITTATLLPPDPSPSGYYGSSVALTATGDELAVGVDGAGSNGQGEVYIVAPRDPAGAGWNGEITQRRMPAPHDEQGRFGTAIAIAARGGTVLATSPFLPVGANAHQGAAYVLEPGREGA